MLGFLSDLTLHTACARIHNRHRFRCAIALLCPENTFVIVIHCLWLAQSHRVCAGAEEAGRGHQVLWS